MKGILIKCCYLIVVLFANGGQLLRSVDADSSEVFDLSGVSLMDAIHLLHAILSDSIDLLFLK